MNIINLTPHPVIVLRDDPEGEITGFTGVGPATKEGRFSLVAEFPPSGQIARAVQTDEVVGALEIQGHRVPLVSTKFGEPTGLPEPADNVYYIVSSIAAQAAKAAGRDVRDLLITSDPVRDAEGKILGIRRFALL